MATLFVDKVDPQSGTALEIGTSGDTITVPSGATLNVAGTITNSGTATGFGGITNSQIWLLTSDQALTGNSSMADITANLAESGLTGYARIGDAMTVSSGVFTFPVTGIWTVEAIFNFVGSDGYCQGRIQATTNNSSYSDVSLSSEETDNQEYANAFLKAQVDVTDTANVKVKFGQGGTISGNALKGSSSYMRTGFFFTRLADT